MNRDFRKGDILIEAGRNHSSKSCPLFKVEGVTKMVDSKSLFLNLVVVRQGIPAGWCVLGENIDGERSYDYELYQEGRMGHPHTDMFKDLKISVDKADLI